MAWSWSNPSITEVMIECEELYIDPIGNSSSLPLDDSRLDYKIKVDKNNKIKIHLMKNLINGLSKTSND